MADSDHPVQPSDASVTFSVKELIGRVDAKLDRVLDGLEGKATAQSVTDLTVRVALLETSEIQRHAVTDSFRRKTVMAIPAFGLVFAALGVFAPHFL